jgi:hypothetical protein
VNRIRSRYVGLIFVAMDSKRRNQSGPRMNIPAKIARAVTAASGAVAVATLATAVMPARGEALPPVPGLTCTNAGAVVASLNDALSTADETLARLERNRPLNPHDVLKIIETQIKMMRTMIATSDWALANRCFAVGPIKDDWALWRPTAVQKLRTFESDAADIKALIARNEGTGK